ncbi:MAG: hypothetical protein KBD78_03895 [Oligoflexales bacterium]|nr:hypothetical protein [Oligoflexales bacterium]
MAIDFILNPGPEHDGTRRREYDFYLPAEKEVAGYAELEIETAKLKREKEEFEEIKAATEEHKVILKKRVPK